MEAKDAGDVKGSGGTLEAKGEPVAAPPDPKAPAPPPPRLASVLGEALERMDARANGTEKPIATPWASFNDTMPGGIWPGLHVLVAGTGVGKSTWALQLGLHAAKRGSPVAYVGLELDSAQIALRLVGEHARVGWSKLYTGTASAEQRSRARDAARELEALPFHVEHGAPGGWSAADLLALAERMARAYPKPAAPMLLAVDFLQIVGPEPDVGRQELRERIGRAAYVSRHVAREHNAAVLLVSSLGRAAYDAGENLEKAKLGAELEGAVVAERFIRNPDAIVGLGKESGEIEYAADTVTVALRHTLAVPASEARNGSSRVVFAVPKVRAGRPSWCELRFDGFRFVDAPDDGKALAEELAEEKPKAAKARASSAKASEGIPVP